MHIIPKCWPPWLHVVNISASVCSQNENLLLKNRRFMISNFKHQHNDSSGDFMTSAYIRHFLFFLFFTLFGILLLYQSNPYPISSFFIQPQCPIYSTPLPPTTTALEIEDIPQSLPNRFVSIGNHGEKIVGETFKPEVVKAVEHVDKIEGNSARSFKVNSSNIFK